MIKHNILAKKIKSQFLSINNKIESYFNNLKYFIFNFKKTKFNRDNKVFLIFTGVITVILFYLLIPTFYNKDKIQSQIKNQVSKKYDTTIKFNEKITYGLLPRPHFKAKNLSIALSDREIAKASSVKFYISINSFFSFKKTSLKNLIFKNTDFNIYEKDLTFFSSLLKIEPNENKIIFKDSNIFFKDQNDELLFINKIKKGEFYYDSKKLENVLIAKNEIFKIPYKLSIKNDKFNKKIISVFDSNKIRLNIKNEINYEDLDIVGFLDILFVNKDTSFVYEIKKDSLSFKSENTNNTYDGIVDFKPFYLSANFNYDGISTKNLLEENSIIIDFLKSEVLKNKNLSLNVNAKIKDITNIDELNKLYIKLNIDQGEILFSDSNIMWKDSLKITLIESFLNYDEDQISVIGKIDFNFESIDNFYKAFQIRKNNRNDIKKIQLDFIYNFNNKEINFDNVRVDNKTNMNLQDFLDNYNLGKNKVFNKITFKNFMDDFFSAYSG